MKNNYLLKNMYEVFAFALPLSAGMLINMLSSFIAMRMATQLGQLELAACALAILTFMPVMTVVSTIPYAISILISHHKSEKKSHIIIGQIVKNGYWLALLLMVPSILILWNIDYVLILFKQDPHLIALTRGYFHFAALSMIPALINAVNNQFFAGIGKPRFMMLTSLISFPLIIFFAYGFILGHFGLPALGLTGITCSTFIAQTIVCIGILIYMNFANYIQSYSIFTHPFTPNWTLCKRIFTLGFPIGIQSGVELAVMTIVMYFMGYFGVTALASSQIVSQYSVLVMMITLGLSRALSVLTSNAYGQNNMALVRQYLISAGFILAILLFIVFVIFLVAPYKMIWMYLPDSELMDINLISLTMNLFAVSGLLLLIDGIRNLLSGALRGLQDSQTPMKINVACMWLVSLPMSYFVGFTLNGGPIGLRLGFTFGYFIASILLWWRLQNKFEIIYPVNLKILD